MEIWAATRDPAAANHPFPAPYSVQTLRDELQMRPVVLRSGELEEVEPLSGEAEREFPEPVGRAKGIYTLHSELATLPSSLPSLREGSFRLCLSPGLLEKLLALEEGELPEPYTQSPESVAVHEVELRADGERVVGRTVTRGGARSRPPSRPRAPRWRSRRAGWRRPGCARRSSRWRIPRRFSGCSTPRSAGGPDLSQSCGRHVTSLSLGCLSWQRRRQHPGARRRLVEEVSVPQRSGDKRFSSIVQLLEGAEGRAVRPVRVHHRRDGPARPGHVARA